MRELESLNIKVVNTSFLYESEPMYVADQDPFLNAVVMVRSITALASAGSHGICNRRRRSRNRPSF